MCDWGGGRRETDTGIVKEGGEGVERGGTRATGVPGEPPESMSRGCYDILGVKPLVTSSLAHIGRPDGAGCDQQNYRGPPLDSNYASPFHNEGGKVF